jgi:hypothetical protein
MSTDRRIIALLCWAAACNACCNVCCAQPLDDGTDAAMVVEQSLQSYVVNRDGSYTLTVDEVRTIAQQRAVAAHGQRTIAYNRNLDRLVAVAAHTRKPDGRRLAAGPDMIRDQALPGAASTAREMRASVVTFPSVAVGDKLVLHYVIRRVKAPFPGHFDDLSSSRFWLNRQFILSYDMPAGMPLHADAVGFRELAAPRAPGRKRYRWQYVAGKDRRIDASSASVVDNGKRLVVSTFDDYGAFALAVRNRASPRQAEPTPAIDALAARLVAGLRGRRDKALALANWVRKNIDHVGAGGFKEGAAHAANSVLARRHGDSEDHASLLAALLLAAGIDSSAALVNGEHAYRISQTPAPSLLNHMIVYVPGLDLFLDTTAKSTAAGYLPPPMLGKPALLIASGQLASTPAFQLEQNRNRILFQLDKSGASRFRVIKTATGAIAEPYRQALREATTIERDSMVRRMLHAIGYQGDGVTDPGQIDGDSDRYQMAFAGISEHFVNFPGRTTVATSFNFWGGLSDSVHALARASLGSGEFVCLGFDSVDEIAFEFAPGVQVLTLPKPLALRAAALDYRADYVRKDNTVTVRRHVRFSPADPVCKGHDDALLPHLLQQILNDLNSEIAVQAL